MSVAETEKAVGHELRQLQGQLRARGVLLLLIGRERGAGVQERVWFYGKLEGLVDVED